jgi:hypothetical protein
MANGALTRKPPVAPPVYRPQQLPKVLQRKTATGQNPQAGQAPRQPVAPPVYRPEVKKIVQPKAINAQRNTASSAHAHTLPKAPTLYRPQAQPVSVQAKMPESSQVKNRPLAPPVYRPQPPPKVLQAKMLVSQQANQTQLSGVQRKISVPGAQPPRALQPGTASPFHAPRLSAHAGASRPAGSVVQRSKRKQDDDDDDYVDPSEVPKEKQLRFNFLKPTAENVIRSTAHNVVHFDAARFNAVYTCPTCRRMLAYEDTGGVFHLTQYGYISKSSKVHKQRALELDHHPEPWAERLDDHKKKGSTNDEMREDYQDETRLRALCRVCNGSHKYENKDVDDYDSDSSDDDFDPKRTPKHETQYNSGSFSGYREPTWLSGY